MKKHNPSVETVSKLKDALARHEDAKRLGRSSRFLSRLAGEIGELVAEAEYGMKRSAPLTPDIDGILPDGQMAQVKALGDKSITDAVRVAATGVDVLLVIKIDLGLSPPWRTIYFGSARDALDASWHKLGENGKKQITLYHLGMASGAVDHEYIAELMERYNRNTTISLYKRDQIDHVRRLGRQAK